MPLLLSQQNQVANRKRSEAGLTLVELIVAFSILLILTSMAVPLARYKIRRDKEKDLRVALREMRTAIDRYRDFAERGQLGIQKIETYNYPPTLETLVEGVTVSGIAGGSADAKMKFLRRIPKDPMTNSIDWGKRSMQDDPSSSSWGGQNVFDVYTKSIDKAGDGTPYSEW